MTGLKYRFLIIITGISILTGIIPVTEQNRATAQVSVSFQVFYDQLSPFGTWVSYPNYGYVWMPGAGGNFRPYGTRGHWVYAEEGWTWISDYSWGWAPFHYGNWFYDDSYGWMWAPGYQWAPAWVTWGEYGGNYCWAPVGPRVDIGVSFGSYRPPYHYWNFCPRERITSTHISNYYVTNIRNTTVINKITVINNVNRGSGPVYLRGPAPANVERFTHRQVRPVAIQASSRPGAANVQNGRLAIYRPAIQRENSTARPAQLRDMHALRPANSSQGRPQGTVVNNPGNKPVNSPDRSSRTVQQHQIPAQSVQQQQRPAPQQQQQHSVQQQHPVSQPPGRQQSTPQQPQRPIPQQQPPQQQQRPIPPQHQQPQQQRPQPQQQRPIPQQQRPQPQHPVQPAQQQPVRQAPPHQQTPPVRNQPPPHQEQAPRQAPPHEH
ncbi:DUF6600 domain-containing protein [Flavitalea flava]